ncbi:MAG: hypothetical protein WAN17_17325 [Candidatus Sulfotelmatobacter sp.]
MSIKIFFSWQSDRSTTEGRNLIEKALEKAVSVLAADVEIQKAVRDGIRVDKDTRDIPGSPKIFETILAKIEEAAIVVCDLTFIGTRPNGDPMPNPNVLIEYGYALKAIGERRILLVMNSAYGEPRRETMPFDLLGHRFPITYHAPERAEEAERKAARNQLAEVFESALRTFFESEEYRNSLPKPIPILYREPKNGRARFRAKGDAIGLRQHPFADITGSPQDELFLAEGPSTWLRVGPQNPAGKTRKVNELEDVSRSIILLPFYEPGPSIGSVRGVDGYGFYRSEGLTEPTGSLVYVFTDGEVWTINTLFLALRPDLLLLEEGKFVKSLEQCSNFLKGLNIPGPYRWVAGMEGVKNRHLREDRFGRRTGICLVNIIEEEGVLKSGDDPQKAIEPFFEEVFDKCGLRRRPDPAAQRT